MYNVVYTIILYTSVMLSNKSYCENIVFHPFTYY
jgi:hypothetical protein